ncbi:MAG: helix-turn-helix transcriptional regulator [Lentihominibacter sp.]|nr:helix-turn-helix transcriptional regulator [Lentihominibacter sp.]
MKDIDSGQMAFFSEMSERQISAREFFSNVLLDSLYRNFGLDHVLILCFDTTNGFLSWTDRSGITIGSENHPYSKFAADDIISRTIYEEAVRDRLDYFNVEPRIYKSTDLIPEDEYDDSEYVHFIQKNFGMHYSVTLAFGINAYIRICFFKSLTDGDFTDDEMKELENIYVYVASSYKNFKKHEQEKIISSIQDEIISSGEKAYLVTDDFMHIMSYNRLALNYLIEILGPEAENQIDSSTPCAWLPFLIEGGEPADREDSAQTRVRTKVIRGYIFKIYTYDQSYSHGIIDRYHWITISEKEEHQLPEKIGEELPLTHAEHRVAELLYQGLTYQAIADELIISYHTVKKHVQNIYSKCGVKSRYQLQSLLDRTKQ